MRITKFIDFRIFEYYNEFGVESMKLELRKLIVPSEDSIIIYTTQNANPFCIEQIGEIKETEYITL